MIGLLGAPGSGKSFVAQRFARHGCAVIDSDMLARQALDEPSVRDRLACWFGPQVLDETGRVNRQALGRIVFSDGAALQRLESLTHPVVHARREQLRRQYNTDDSVLAIVEDTPLLLEKGLAGQCDVLVFVEADRPTRLARVSESRGWDAQELARREKNQASLDIKRARADHVVTNHAGEADEADVDDQVRRVLSQILHRRA